MQLKSMARPARIEDPDLADKVRSYMKGCRLSVEQMSDMVAIDKSTLSRSLKSGAFSKEVRQRLRHVVDPIGSSESVDKLVQKALRLLAASDRLRERADQMLIQALDQSAASK